MQRVAGARSRHRGARAEAGGEARPAGKGGAADRRVSARVPLRGRAARRGQRDGGARARGEARAGGPVHERGHAPADGRSPRPARRSAGGAAQALVPGLGRGGVGARLRPRRRAGAHARAERAARDRHPARSRRDRRRSRPTFPAPTASSAWTSRRWPKAGSGRRAAARSSLRSPSAPLPGDRTLDVCAAPGGKATQLAGEVVAVEKHEGRARELAANAARLGATNVRVVNADALALPDELRGFDRALVDAPCSGLGVLNSRPDLRWRAEPLPDLQLALLRAAADRVKPGGTVVYSVCTLNADENEAVVDASGLAVGRPRRRLARLPPPDATGVPAHAAARPPHVGLLRRPPKVTS